MIVNSGKWSCGVCGKGEQANSVKCTVYNKWIHKRVIYGAVLTPPSQTIAQTPHRRNPNTDTRPTLLRFPQDWVFTGLVQSYYPLTSYTVPSHTHFTHSTNSFHPTLIPSTSTAIGTISEPRLQPTHSCPALTAAKPLVVVVGPTPPPKNGGAVHQPFLRTPADGIPPSSRHPGSPVDW